MEISSTRETDIYIIEIDGDVDASSAILLDNAIEGAFKNGEKKIIVNCSRLEYISSAGLGVFMSYISDFKENGVKMILFEVSEKVINVFKILGLDALIEIVNDKSEAIEICNQ